MFYRDICKILGTFLFGLSLALAIPFFLAIYYQYFADPLQHPQPHSTNAFFYTILICVGCAFLCRKIGQTATGQLYRREGLASVVIIWFLTPLIAALPFLFSGTLTNPFQAYFEASSGITTTGSTVMQAKQYNPETSEEVPIRHTFCGVLDTEYVFFGTIPPVKNPETHEVIAEGIEAVSKALLFWRSFLQWLGGVGIIVLFIAILPAFGVGGKMLFRTEMSGPIKESITPRIKETAAQMWKIYLGLTILQIFLLIITNSQMTWLDAVTTTFGTLSTGGLSIRNDNIASYHSSYTEWIVMVFMLLGSINFSLYYYLLRGKFYRLNDPELWIYLGIIFLACGFTCFTLLGTTQTPLSGESSGVYSLSKAFRLGSFHIISAISSTGFFIVDYDQWPFSLQALLLILMLIGGMAGSTAGGIKIIRYYILFKLCHHKVESLFRPEVIHKIRVGGHEIDHNTATTVLCFFMIVIGLITFGTFLYILDGIDPMTAFSSAICLITNGGMGFGMGGPRWSYAFLSNFSTLISSILMLLGRLEIFAVFVFLLPAFWKHSR